MSTRLTRPAVWRPLGITVALLAFQGYLGFNVIGGQFGIESQKVMKADIEELKAQSGSLQAELDSYRHKVDLFNPQKLDPDILTERARALLSMAVKGDIVVMTDAAGKPITSSSPVSTENEIMPNIAAGID